MPLSFRKPTVMALAAVPEPASLAVLSVGLGLGAIGWRRSGRGRGAA